MPDNDIDCVGACAFQLIFILTLIPCVQGRDVAKAILDDAATRASAAFHVCPNLELLVAALQAGGIEELEKRCVLTPGAHDKVSVSLSASKFGSLDADYNQWQTTAQRIRAWAIQLYYNIVLTTCRFCTGVPLKPMLAKICNGIPDALRQLKGAFLAEYKYDGQRAQIHLLRGGAVKVFSRNSEDKTGAFPDVIDAVRAASAGADFRYP